MALKQPLRRQWRSVRRGDCRSQPVTYGACRCTTCSDHCFIRPSAWEHPHHLGGSPRLRLGRHHVWLVARQHLANWPTGIANVVFYILCSSMGDCSLTPACRSSTSRSASAAGGCGCTAVRADELRQPHHVAPNGRARRGRPRRDRAADLVLDHLDRLHRAVRDAVTTVLSLSRRRGSAASCSSLVALDRRRPDLHPAVPVQGLYLTAASTSLPGVVRRRAGRLAARVGGAAGRPCRTGGSYEARPGPRQVLSAARRPPAPDRRRRRAASAHRRGRRLAAGEHRARAACRLAAERRPQPHVDIVPAVTTSRSTTTDAVWAAQVAIIRTAARAPVDVVFSSEEYGPELARRFGAAHVASTRRANASRSAAPPFAEDPVACWRPLSPPVRAHLARRVVVVGAESSGTTTLARALAEHYRDAAEYGPDRAGSRSTAGSTRGEARARARARPGLPARSTTSPGPRMIRRIAERQPALEDEAAAQAHRC